MSGTTLRRHDCGNLPAIQQVFCGAIELVKKRHIVEDGDDTALLQVESGDRAIALRVIRILWRADVKAAADLPPDIGRSRNGFGPCVSTEKSEALAYSAFGLDLECVINRVPDRLIDRDGSLEELVGTARGD